MENRVKKKKRYFLFGACAAILCLFGSEGCKREEPKYMVSMLAEQFPTKDTNAQELLSAIEDFTGTSLEIELIPTLEYAFSVEHKIRSNELPMVLTVNETIMESQSFSAYLNAGGFWELDTYLDEYPNLKAFVEDEIWELSKIKGHFYGIPRLRIRPRYAACYRKDWAEKLKLNPPETLDEIYTMLKAFTQEDPDENGKNDTIGLVSSWQNWKSKEWNGISTVTTALGGPNGWEYQEETQSMIPDFSTPEYLQTLQWFQKLYQEKLLDSSFPFLTAVQRQEKFVQGQAGMIFCVIDDVAELEEKLHLQDPDAEVEILPLISNKGNEYRVNATSGYNGLFVFNRLGKNTLQTEEQLRSVLEFYDKLCSQKGQELLLSGDAGSYKQLMPMPAYSIREKDSVIQKKTYELIEERTPWLVTDDSYSLESLTYTIQGEELNKIIQRASVRFIMGEITEEDYWREYKLWYDTGGKNVIEEYTKAYKQKKSG